MLTTLGAATLRCDMADGRDSIASALLSDLRTDLRYAERGLRRSPGFAFLAILSLALGVGVNTLVFSAVNAVALSDLPIDRPDRVFFVQPGSGPTFSFPNYRDLRDRNVTFDGLIGYRVSPMNAEIGGTTHRTWGYL